MSKRSEERLSINICQYLDMQYPHVIYTCDLSGIKLTIGQSVKAKKQRCKNYKIPDLLILERNRNYCGLIIELKKDFEEVYLKDGSLRNSEHIQAQNKSLNRLMSNGYYAVFGCGFEQTKHIIDVYMKNR